MDITIFGSGYVGLVTGACFADEGHHVICVDIDPAKVAALEQAQVPFYEPGLSEMVKRNVAAGRLKVTTDAASAIADCKVIFIAVGTPSADNGDADMRYVYAVADTIGQHIPDYRLVVDKSTVPVGTADAVRERIAAQLQQRGAEIDFDVASNPEFLKEGSAIADFLKPDRVIIGVPNKRSENLLQQIYQPFQRSRNRVQVMDVRSAELTKYAANAMLASRISFMNELSQIADRVGADIEHVRHGIGSDSRIGYKFIYPGCGYGGSCFPKDVKALASTARQVGYTAELVEAIERVNDRQKHILFARLQQHFGEEIKGKTIAVWGLAFKPNTDDMRDAPSVILIESLLAAGAQVQAFDPEASAVARSILGDRISYANSAEAAAKQADALVLVTEWHLFRNPNWAKLKKSMNGHVVVDGRNVYDPQVVREAGFSYYAIGRPAAA